MEWIVLIGIVLLFALAARETEGQRIKKRREQAYKFAPVAYDNPNSASSAQWASDKLLKWAGLFKGKGIRIGYSQSGKVLRYGGPGNLILIAPARTGKLVSVLAAALLERPARKSSRLVIDPKGELCAITAHRAAQFSDVVAIDPFGTLKKHGVRGVKVVGFNPLAALDPKSVSFGGDVDSVTDGVFAHEPGGGDNAAFFNDSAALLLSTGIRPVMKYGRQNEKNLVAVREAICRDIFSFARRFANCGDAAVEAELSRYTSKLAPQSKSVEDIVSTFRTQTAFIGMEGIRESLMQDGIRALDLKRKPMTVFLILPLSFMPVFLFFRTVAATPSIMATAFPAASFPVTTRRAAEGIVYLQYDL
jgi:type IV secretion system protein VirD4